MDKETYRGYQVLLLVDSRDVCSICLFADDLLDKGSDQSEHDLRRRRRYGQGYDLGTSVEYAQLQPCVSLVEREVDERDERASDGEESLTKGMFVLEFGPHCR
jgi:hypothetical protein